MIFNVKTENDLEQWSLTTVHWVFCWFDNVVGFRAVEPQPKQFWMAGAGAKKSDARNWSPKFDFRLHSPGRIGGE